MKIEVSIEEMVVEKFELDIPEGVEPYDFIRDEYYKDKIVLKPGECQFKQMEIHDLTDDSWTEWIEF
jgi:hypothetical protein